MYKEGSLIIYDSGNINSSVSVCVCTYYKNNRLYRILNIICSSYIDLFPGHLINRNDGQDCINQSQGVTNWNFYYKHRE